MDIDDNPSGEPTLFEIIKEKDSIFHSLQEMNIELVDTIGTLSKKCSDVNSKLTKMTIQLEQGSNHNNISDDNEKLLRENIYLKQNYAVLKATYDGLNKVYISNIKESRYSQIVSLQIQNASLEKKLDEIKDSFKCQVCDDAYINVIIQPCYHIYICKECLLNIMENARPGISKCPVCSQDILEYKDIYIPI